jgi:hypothetical protein
VSACSWTYFAASASLEESVAMVFELDGAKRLQKDQGGAVQGLFFKLQENVRTSFLTPVMLTNLHICINVILYVIYICIYMYIYVYIYTQHVCVCMCLYIFLGCCTLYIHIFFSDAPNLLPPPPRSPYDMICTWSTYNIHTDVHTPDDTLCT